jgi:quinohemoprotein ethanol dehydrogenase
VIAGGMAPDLRASSIATDKILFTEVVRNGSKVKMGMPSFPEITDEELTSLMHYIRTEARSSIKAKAVASPH